LFPQRRVGRPGGRSRWWLVVAAVLTLAALSVIGRGFDDEVGPTQPVANATASHGPASTSASAAAATASATASAPAPSASAADTTEPVLGAAPIGPTEHATVVRVVDGDTIVIDRGFGEERLRYIGVDTPETVAPGSPVEWMGPEASAANKALVEGREVVLERDVSEVDRFGRLLRYVWLQDGSVAGAASGWLLVNLALVARGFAQVSTFPPDVRYVDLYLEAQRRARDEGLGLWGEVPEPTDEPGGGGDCDPAYPTVCIPPAPPDLDCGDITFRRFVVKPPDPHGFDGDHDGVGCES
jgi:micrococcal nuclease